MKSEGQRLTASVLEKKFREAITTSDVSTFAEDQSVLSVLHTTDWVRIIIVQGNETGLQIEVELSPPQRTAEDQNEMIQKFTGMIVHLKYLLQLGHSGFSLSTSEEDCLWTATLGIDDDIESSIFELILPPESRNP
jgi:hypothetical protein